MYKLAVSLFICSCGSVTPWLFTILSNRSSVLAANSAISLRPAVDSWLLKPVSTILIWSPIASGVISFSCLRIVLSILAMLIFAINKARTALFPIALPTFVPVLIPHRDGEWISKPFSTVFITVFGNFSAAVFNVFKLLTMPNDSPAMISRPMSNITLDGDSIPNSLLISAIRLFSICLASSETPLALCWIPCFNPSSIFLPIFIPCCSANANCSFHLAL